QPEYRRRGIFRRLYETLIEQAAACGTVCGLRLYVERENTRAQKTYERLGLFETHYQMYEADFVLRH
ncbi:MAG: GNAT family N-acetyltransferase, partial [Acidobacteria bacterium]|nr:GNAT family N-acetyltransferase [Acidobacteriota bacterium]